MQNLVYRILTIEDCKGINDINPAQYISRAWREVNGNRQLVQIDYQESDWPNGYETHYNSLKDTILSGGAAFGAFDNNNKLIGFATINKNFYGDKLKYLLLDQLFITLEHRNKGIGKKLFMLCADLAREWNGDKLLICAGSAEETVAFYFAIGCEEAMEINQEFYEDDPRDYQLEFSL
ncbi:GNAT family N-acetyltransferase [Oceanirhabdus sp. W0125-5]|uniref:GNAT family N-acetyltransferase n=1 Tax=Oceanirhabdus sp. W0125-5 TaxID=2999116 RepID=UPI0022F2DBAF|nr:GNAT family N-acetyltransferase [Oceanirhabdus sp. W0125-5]WBW96057.1 GNAT family N-acetyltransferase [Oceanirhabdus sp. W0125-5]